MTSKRVSNPLQFNIQLHKPKSGLQTQYSASPTNGENVINFFFQICLFFDVECYLTAHIFTIYEYENIKG